MNAKVRLARRLRKQGVPAREILKLIHQPEGLALLNGDDRQFLKPLCDLGMSEQDAIDFLKRFLLQKTGEAWSWITWDPTAEDPEPRSEFVRDRDLEPM